MVRDTSELVVPKPGESSGAQGPQAPPPADKPALPAGGHRDRYRWLGWLNQPLPVGILILVVSTGTQQLYWKAQQRHLAQEWKSQQRFLAQQAIARELVAHAAESEELVTSAIGKVLAAAGMIVGAHEAAIPKEQLLPIIDRYNDMQREWDMGEDELARRLRADFPSPAITAGWKDILDQRDKLNEEVSRLSPTFPAPRAQIDACRRYIVGMEERLEALTRLTQQDLQRRRQAIVAP